MTGNDFAKAAAAAQLASWSWDQSTGRLNIAATSIEHLTGLNGDWVLPTFLKQLDGLDHGQLSRALNNGKASDNIDVEFSLRNGYPARLIGSFSAVGLAHGLVITTAKPERKSADMSRLTAVYQPIYDLKNDHLAGFEALARLRLSGGELVGPEYFQPYIDNKLAPLMLEQAVSMLEKLYPRRPSLFIQINMSAMEIACPKLIDRMIRIADKHPLLRGQLRMELTEQAAIRDDNLVEAALARLQEAGFGLVLDDFGAGHSSLAWLAGTAAQGIKIDPRLVARAEDDRGAMILARIIALAHDLGMTVTAEGVEKIKTARFFAELGCDLAQGHALGHPLEEEAACKLVDQSKIDC